MSLVRIIPMSLHAVVEYLAGIVLVAAPFTFDWSGATATVSLVAGIGALAVSLFTDYDLSLVKLVPIEIHSVADYVVGGLLIVAPFIARYADTVAGQFHLWLGVAIVGVSVLTAYRPSARRRVEAGWTGRERRIQSIPVERERRRA